MSDASAQSSPGRWQRLPVWLRPGDGAQEGAAGASERSRTRLVETTLLVAIGVVLAVATVNDVVRQTHINHRLDADLSTWRHYTHHDYFNIAIDQETLGLGRDREVLCGNTSPGPPGSRTQVCLAIWGPVHDGLRTVHGGWYLHPYVPDIPAQRYGCFGAAGVGKCPT